MIMTVTAGSCRIRISLFALQLGLWLGVVELDDLQGVRRSVTLGWDFLSLDSISLISRVVFFPTFK